MLDSTDHIKLMYLADAFPILIFYRYIFLGNRSQDLCRTKAMLTVNMYQDILVTYPIG